MSKSQRQLDDERKANEYQDLMQLSEYSPLIKIKALDAKGGLPPTHYEITYTCRGYNRPGQMAERFVVYMVLGADYPRVLPLFQYDSATPIYHPHVFPSLSGVSNYICIGHNNSMAIGLPLREYVLGVGEMIQWRKDAGTNQPADVRSLVGREPIPNASVDELPPAPAVPASIAPAPLITISEEPIVINLLGPSQEDEPFEIRILEADSPPADDEIVIRVLD